MQNIGLKIRKIREIKNLSRAEMAANLNLSERGYGKLENGEVQINLQKLEEIANVLEIDPIKLLQFEEGMIFKKCNNNSSLVNNGTINSANLEELIKAKDAQIESLKEIIKIKDELLNQYRK